MAGTVCNFATQLKFFAGYDDSLDVSFYSVFGVRRFSNLYPICQKKKKKKKDFCISRYRWNRWEHLDCSFCPG